MDVELVAAYEPFRGRRLYRAPDGVVTELATCDGAHEVRTVGVGAVQRQPVAWDHRMGFDILSGKILSWSVDVDRGKPDRPWPGGGWENVWISSPRGDPTFECTRSVRLDLVAPVVHAHSTFLHSLLLSSRYPGPPERDGTLEREVVHLYLSKALLRPTTARYHRTGDRTWTAEVLEDRFELETNAHGIVVSGPLHHVPLPYPSPQH